MGILRDLGFFRVVIDGLKHLFLVFLLVTLMPHDLHPDDRADKRRGPNAEEDEKGHPAGRWVIQKGEDDEKTEDCKAKDNDDDAIKRGISHFTEISTSRPL